MNINYEFLYSGIPVGGEESIIGLLVKDVDSNATYILQIPLTDITPVDGKIGPFDMVEVLEDSLEMVHASTLLQSKSVNPSNSDQVVIPDSGFVGLSSVEISKVELSKITVSANTISDQTVTPTSPALGFFEVKVNKFTGESGAPDSEYKNGDVLLISSLPAKFSNRVDRVAEFDGKYKGIVSDTETTYANVQIIYKDNTLGPRLPLYDLIGKVSIEVDESEDSPVYTFDEKNLFDAIQKGEKVSVVLENDIPVSNQLKVTNNVELNLNGHTLSFNEDYSGSYVSDNLITTGVVAVGRGGKLVIRDTSADGSGAIDGTVGFNAMCGIAVTAPGEAKTGDLAELVVESGTIRGVNYGISGNGLRQNTKVTILGGNISAANESGNNEATAIYNPQEGTVIIKDGNFFGYDTALEIRSGNLIITGGNFESKVIPEGSVPNSDGTTTKGAAIGIAQHTTKKAISVDISGGYFKGCVPVFESNPQNNNANNKVTVSITGGNFTSILGANGEAIHVGNDTSVDTAACVIDTSKISKVGSITWLGVENYA